MKRIITILLSLALMAGTAAPTWAQGAKEDIKEAGRSTKNAVKKTGRAIKKGTKKVIHAGAKQTRKGAGKIEEKTEKK